jgi:hypothetical protein
MAGWRFYPLEGFKRQGLLVPPYGNPQAAEFLTPQTAKAIADERRRAA